MKRKRTTGMPKRRSATKVARGRRSLVGGKDKRIALLTRERDEAREQQTATSEVLKVISSSPGELEPVFQTMLENATRICKAKFGVLWLTEGEGFRPAANLNLPRALTVERKQNEVMKPIPEDPLGQLAATKQMIHVFDARAATAYKSGFRPFVALVDDGGARTLLVVPLLREDELIGALAIFRQEVRPFTEKQIELVKNFAAQAVIAIENTRLLNELQESLAQQTGTSEVLSVIARSPGKLEPVFQTILEQAVNICGAKFATLYLAEGDGFRAAALHNTPPELEKVLLGALVRPGPYVPLGRVAASKTMAHIADMKADRCYIERDPMAVMGVELGGYRTVLVVPMLKDDVLVGAIAIYGQEVQLFNDSQAELPHHRQLSG